jgi:hypothetical protein
MLTDLGLSEGYPNDLTLKWLHLNGASSANVNDAWQQCNAIQNAEKNLNDSWFK